MRGKDWVFLAATFGSMALGMLVPGLAEPLIAVPRVTMMGMLFLCFLSVELLGAWQGVRAAPFAVVTLAALKLLALPMLCWGVFRVIMPEYAFGALLLGGASLGVVAPFFGLLLKADVVLLLVNVVLTSLLLPLTLPLVAGLSGGPGFALPFWDMAGTLCMIVFIPFAAGQAVRRAAGSLSGLLLRHRDTLALALISLGNIAIFSRYSLALRQNPEAIPPALLAACLLGALLFALGLCCSWSMALERQLAFMIGFTIMNNILILILSAEFFSLAEVLMAAFYTVPFYALFIPFQALRRLRGAKD